MRHTNTHTKDDNKRKLNILNQNEIAWPIKLTAIRAVRVWHATYSRLNYQNKQQAANRWNDAWFLPHSHTFVSISYHIHIHIKWVRPRSSTLQNTTEDSIKCVCHTIRTCTLCVLMGIEPYDLLVAFCCCCFFFVVFRNLISGLRSKIDLSLSVFYTQAHIYHRNHDNKYLLYKHKYTVGRVAYIVFNV